MMRKPQQKRVQISSSLASAARSMAQASSGELTPESIDAKRAIFADLDRISAPDAMLASSTSTIVASLFSEKLKGRHRCLWRGAIRVNPPHLVPLVEHVGAPWTSPETLASGEDDL